MSDFSRHQLKKNELVDIVMVVADWIRNNRTAFFSIIGTVVFVVILAIVFVSRVHMSRARAADKLSMAQGQLYQGKPDEGVRLLDELIVQYPRTAAAFRARLTKAEVFLDQRRFAEAEESARPVADSGLPDNVRPLALSLLGSIQESAGKYPEAIGTYSRFIDRYPEHFLAPRIYESLGRTYEFAGRTQDAKSTYEKLATLYPATGWAESAQERIAALPGTADPSK